jgi:hypothetical protein
MQDFEKLGVFYLGREYNLETRTPKDNLILYDSRDLVTHAVCLGMTGSGKTGLCICLLEEAAIDGIPAIIIDPKGDVSDLLLMFPDLTPADFAPWINTEDARNKGITPEQYAADQAETWSKGLAEWGESGDRIRKLKSQVDLSIYTPGSSAGIPVSILKSFAAPPKTTVEDAELFRERILTTTSSLLGLLNIEANPLQSREHILISTILEQAWSRGSDLDLPALIHAIQTPPVSRIGVFDLESFYPSSDRFSLAMSINNLLAAPGFDLWMQGQPLDPAKLLYTDAGKPKISIFSISHLSDSERMFFVSLLFSQVLGWMRTQSGTSSLRALLYMDEIFGYLPPVANPPSKTPLLTMLKQARAFGLGVVLATQNPVDLDYKALANAGTWFIGRLQTERDKARLLDGLESISTSGFRRDQMEKMIGQLSNRIFIMNNVHEEAPVVFETRWALSYLRGPLTRNEIKTLMQSQAGEAQQPQQPPEVAAARAVPTQTVQASSAFVQARPSLPPDVQQFFLPAEAAASGESLLYQPSLLGIANIYYADAKAGIASQQNFSYLAQFASPAIPWDQAESIGITEQELEKLPAPDATYSELPPEASNAKSYPVWSRDFSDWLFRTQTLKLYRSNSLSQLSKPGESESDFRIRLQQMAREQRDRLVERLRQKYATRIDAMQERIRRAQAAMDRESEQAKQQKLQTAISFGTTVLGALFGRKRLSVSTLGRATTAARGVGRTVKESEDIDRAAENVQALRQQLSDIESQLKAETDQAISAIDPQNESLQTVELRPKKSNIAIRVLSLSWVPYRQDPQGRLASALRQS